MEPFRCPDPADRQWVLPLLAAEGEMGCEYNFDNIYLWSRAYPQKIARLGDRLLVHALDAPLGEEIENSSFQQRLEKMEESPWSK